MARAEWLGASKGDRPLAVAVALLQMPVTYSLDRSVLTLHMLGTYSPAEIRSALVAALADERARGLAGLVFDLHESRSISTRTLGDMTANTGFLAYHAGSLANRIAFVLPPTIDDTLVRMASVDLGTAGVTTEIFHDIEEAARWLRARASEDSSRL